MAPEEDLPVGGSHGHAPPYEEQFCMYSCLYGAVTQELETCLYLRCLGGKWAEAERVCTVVNLMCHTAGKC